MLDGGFLASHSSLNMLEDIPWHSPIVKDLYMDVLLGQVFKGLSYLNLTLWLLTGVCCTDKDSIPQSVRQWGVLKYLQCKSTSNVEKDKMVGVLQWVYQTMPYLPLN